MKHTKGEWKINDRINIDSESGLSIATVFWNSLPYHTTMVTKEEGEANIKLIAAAPELLDALQSLMNVYETKGQLLSFDVNIARNAIKKATE